MHKLYRSLLTLFVLVALWVLSGCSCEQSANTPGKLATNVPDNRLVFTTQPTTTPMRKELLIFNDGAVPLTLTAATLAGEETGRFKLLNVPTFPLTVAPGKAAGVTVGVALTPTSPKGAVVRLVLSASNTSNVDSQGHFTIFVEHRVVQGALKFTCLDGLDFGALSLGKSRTKLCELRNVGAVPVEVEGVKYVAERGEAGMFKWVSPSLPVVIEPHSTAGTGHTVQIQFRPKLTKQYDIAGSFVLQTDLFAPKGTAPPTLSVRGVAAIPEILPIVEHGPCTNPEDCHFLHPQLSCDTLGRGSSKCYWFGAKAEAHFFVNSKLLSPRLLLANTGSGKLLIDEVDLKQGQNRIFSTTTKGLGGGIVGGSWRPLDLSILVPPTTEQTDAVLITSNGANQPELSVKLVANMPACRLQVLHLPWESGVVGVGPKFVKSFRVPILHNLGELPCSITKIGVKSGPSTGQGVISYVGTTAFPYKLAAARYGPTLTLTYEGKDESSAQATLVIESNDPRRPIINIPIVGAGKSYQPCLEVRGGRALRFPVTYLGVCAPAQKITVTHRGGTCGPIQITSATWALLSSHLLTVSSSKTLPVTLSAKQSVALTIQYTGPYDVEIDERAALLIKTGSAFQPSFRIDVEVVAPNAESYTDRYLLAGPPPVKQPRFTLKQTPSTPDHLYQLTLSVGRDRNPVRLYTYDAKTNEAVVLDTGLWRAGETLEIEYLISCAPNGAKPPKPIRE